ncbi:hypothetical protein Tco_1142379 [Tanacetum coccineum]
MTDTPYSIDVNTPYRYQQGHRAAFGQDLHRQQVNVEERVLGLEADGTRDVEGIRSRRLVSITPADWVSRLFWLDPKECCIGRLTMLKTRLRARSYAGRDPGQLLSSKICRWRARRLESEATTAICSVST